MSMAKGLLPDSHPQSVAAARSLALARADVVMLVGARLNWLLGHGASPPWSADAKFIQIDVAASEFDSNRPIAAPLAGDIGSVMSALLDRVDAHPIADRPRGPVNSRSVGRTTTPGCAIGWPKIRTRCGSTMRLRAVRDVLQQHPEVYLVNEGANALDVARNVIDMQLPRHRLDSGTWGVMGIGMGYAIAAAVETGQPVVALEGDSAFGFSGMEFETICRYRLPITVVILNNGGVYRGDETSGADPAPTVLNAHARHELIAEAFGGKGYHVTTAAELQSAVAEALASNVSGDRGLRTRPGRGCGERAPDQPQPEKRVPPQLASTRYRRRYGS